MVELEKGERRAGADHRNENHDQPVTDSSVDCSNPMILQ